MPLPSDPLLAQQWHLINTTPGLLDLNVAGVWNPAEGQAYTGEGVWVVVIDDGFDYLHSDLAPNYNTALDFDYDGADLDPFGNPTDAHGTAVTGIIGAAANGTGAVGVAFGAELIGYRTHGFISDFWLQNIRDAIAQAATNALGDVVNISQGIANDTNSEFGVGYDAARFDEIEASINTAVDTGRGGLGTIIVKSAGNSRSANFDVNADDWTNDTRQVVVAAVDQDGFVSSYSSYGAAVLVSAFGTPGEVVTTDRTGADGYDATDFTSGFNGTSAAAPMVSGVVALMLDANASLGWRDVQTILGVSARHVGTEIGSTRVAPERFDWQWNAASTWNGGGQHFSNDYGFGLVDAHAAVRMAESWLLDGSSSQISGNEFTNVMDMLDIATVIPDGNATGLTFTGNAGFDDIVERVTVQISFSTTFTGDMEVYLTSPDGTVSQLIADTGGDNDFNGTWTFESQAFRGERAAGIWSVRVVDDAGADVLTVSDIVVTTYGAFSASDRYVYTDEYADYAGLAGHQTSVTDSNGGTDTVNAAAVTSNSVIRLDGVAGLIAGQAASFTNIENAIGGDGADTIFGNADGNMLYGMRGADVFVGGAGGDAMDGGTGIDRAQYGSAVRADLLNAAVNTGDAAGDSYVSIENLAGSNFNDDLRGDNLANILYGFNGGDTLHGRDGSDSLYGGNNDDVLLGWTGADLLNGGNGIDRAQYSGATAAVRADLLNAAVNTGEAAGDSYVSIENLAGSNFSDDLRGDNLANAVYGFNGGDTLHGRDGSDSLYGGENDDVLLGGAGADLQDGGNGIDRAQYSGATSSVRVDMLNTAVNTGEAIGDSFVSIENLTGSAYGDDLRGDNLANVLSGYHGNDTLHGRDGDDTLNGDNDDDVLLGGLGADVLNGGAGIDSAQYSTAAAGVRVDFLNTAVNTGEAIGDSFISIENLIGSLFNDGLRGDDLANSISGLDGNDTILGRGGNDTIYGGNGLDRIASGLGRDLIYAGVGDGVRDVIVFVSTGETPVGSPNRDVVFDFVSGTDDFDLTGIDANTAVANDQAFTFAGLVAQANSIWYSVVGSNVLVSGDTNGNTTADFEILVANIGVLGAGDFLL